METYPQIVMVVPLPGKRLLVTFGNNTKKIYDCSALIKEKPFVALADETLFKCVKTDYGGYGVSWNDELDLSESELWINGSLTPNGNEH